MYMYYYVTDTPRRQRRQLPPCPQHKATTKAKKPNSAGNTRIQYTPYCTATVSVLPREASRLYSTNKKTPRCRFSPLEDP